MDVYALIVSAFPAAPMPELNRFAVHAPSDTEEDRCYDCEYVRESVGEWQNRETRDETDRFPPLDLFSLSAVGMKWVLPFYLQQCLKNGSYDLMHTERLVYHLGIRAADDKQVLESLSLLNHLQLNCLRIFLEWCGNDSEINEYLAADLKKAKQFLESLPR